MYSALASKLSLNKKENNVLKKKKENNNTQRKATNKARSKAISNANFLLKNPCSGNRYTCLDNIYKYITHDKKAKQIFSSVMPFIQGGYALYLYGYDIIMKTNSQIGTDDIDIHIEPTIDTIITSSDSKIIPYNKQVQTFFVDLCNTFKNTIIMAQINNPWFYGTSNYIDITYDSNYVSLVHYKAYCLANGYTQSALDTHLTSNISNLLLPLEYVKFNCIHMFVLLLQAFGTSKINNRIPKTIKIIKRVIMIYEPTIDPTNYLLLSNELDIYLSTLIDIINKYKSAKNSKDSKEFNKTMTELNNQANNYYISFISKPENINTKFMLYLINALNIQIAGSFEDISNIKNVSSKTFSDDKLLNDCYYDIDEIDEIKDKDELLLNNITALVFKNIIINKMSNSENTKSIVKFLNLTNTKGNTKKNKPTTNLLTKHRGRAITAYGVNLYNYKIK